MEMIAVLKVLGPWVTNFGPFALGWVAAILLFWYLYKIKKEHADALKKANDEVIAAKNEYIKDILVMNGNFTELQNKHNEIISATTEARIEDIKELTADYNQLANDTLTTLDRFVVALETRNSMKRRGGKS